jgi:23S rRNA (guanosine2251-2'-O)-methyltransferase
MRGRAHRPASPPVDTSAALGRLVAGLQPVREAIRVHGAKLRRVAVQAADANERLDALARFARDQGVERIDRVERGELDRLSGGVSHQGALCWAPALVVLGLDDIAGDPRLLALALDGIQDPQNFGAVIRSAVGLAGAPVIWPEHASAPLSAATFRASAGAIEHAQLCRVPSLTGALTDLGQRDIQIIGLDAHAPVALREVDLNSPTVLVLGSEHRGLSRSVRRACRQLARLVEPRSVDSLNASVAAALALYTARIQRDNSAT